jgi:flagellar motor protein MotB
MPVLREQDFDKMASRVVDQFFGGKSKLAEAAAQEAVGAGLNPDQIERLVQAANTMAVLRMMEEHKRQGTGDLTHEFDTIDPQHVIRIVIDEAGVHVDPGMSTDTGPHAAAGPSSEQPPMPPMPPHGDPTNDLPDEMSAQTTPDAAEPMVDEAPPPDGPFGRFAPSKEKKESDPKKKPTEEKKKDDGKASEKAATRQARMRKLAEILADQRRQAELAFDDRFEQLCARFNRAYAPSFDSFEKDAMAEYGDAVGIAVMRSICEQLRRPTASVSIEKTAALADHHVSEDSPELSMFEELCHIAVKSAELEESVAWLRAQCA